MKSRIIFVIVIMAVMIVTVAIASQNCPFGKSDCQTICKSNCAGVFVQNYCAMDKNKSCDKDHDSNSPTDPNSPKDPNG